MSATTHDSIVIDCGDRCHSFHPIQLPYPLLPPRSTPPRREATRRHPRRWARRRSSHPRRRPTRRQEVAACQTVPTARPVVVSPRRRPVAMRLPVGWGLAHRLQRLGVSRRRARPREDRQHRRCQRHQTSSRRDLRVWVDLFSRCPRHRRRRRRRGEGLSSSASRGRRRSSRTSRCQVRRSGRGRLGRGRLQVGRPAPERSRRRDSQHRLHSTPRWLRVAHRRWVGDRRCPWRRATPAPPRSLVCRRRQGSQGWRSREWSAVQATQARRASRGWRRRGWHRGWRQASLDLVGTRSGRRHQLSRRSPRRASTRRKSRGCRARPWVRRCRPGARRRCLGVW